MAGDEKNKTATAIKDVWYNLPPSASNIPFIGLPKNKRTTVSNKKFQQFLTAANKRMIKHWMGNLKYASKVTTDDQEQKLYDWFGQEDGRRHFRGWAEQLGSLGGDRTSATSAHGAGKAVDINYDYNPWCPLCNHATTTTGETFSISGEKLSKKNTDAIEKGENLPYSQILKRCGRVYDRCLRFFVPVKTDTNDDHGFKHFARTYYRNNHDWTLTDSTNGLPPFSPDQIYKQYQILNWSIRFYFNYAFGQIAEFRKEYTNTKDGSKLTEPVDKPNGFSKHTSTVAGSGKELWTRIKTDIDHFRIPPQAEIFINKDLLEKNVTDTTLRTQFFELLDVTYPYESSARQVYRFSLSKSHTDTVTDPNDEIVGKVLLEQIKDDHHALSLGMLYTYPGRRDPCNGVFNLSYETFLAMCYLLTNNVQCRMFGAFVATEAGDMQHFDYGHANRS